MANTRYTEAEAEANFLRFSGLNSFALSLFLSADLVYSWMKKIGADGYLMGIYTVLGILVFGLLIYSFIAIIRVGKDMRRRSFWLFRFEDEYTDSLSNRAQIFSLGIVTVWVFFVMFLSKPKIDFFRLSEMSIHDFATITVSLGFLSYSLPILFSYWKKDE